MDRAVALTHGMRENPLVFGNCCHFVGMAYVVVNVHLTRPRRGGSRQISMVLAQKSHQPEAAFNDAVVQKIERRSRPRVALQWVVHVSRAGGKHPVASLTRNVSSHGFYCVVEEPLESGERVECTVVIPIPKSARADEVLWLKCQARVLRVEPAAADTAFGAAFQIEEYSVVHPSPVEVSPAEQVDGHRLGQRQSRP